MKRSLKKEDILIILLSLILLLSTIKIEASSSLIKDDLYKEKIQASRLMEKALGEVKKEKLNRKIPIDKSMDILGTGIIGEEFNGITTTLGSLESKRTSANPNFAAVMVDLLTSAGLKKGDHIGINFSSSFPALNIASLAACEVLGIKPTIISSLGASTWGGNNPEFTYIDMEEHLYKQGIFTNKSMAISIGGGGDIGKDMDGQIVGGIIDRLKEEGKIIIYEADLKKNISYRYDLYKSGGEIKGFMNIGGNLIAFGNTMDSDGLSPGIVKKNFKTNDRTGLVQLFQSKNISVIHILNIKDLAVRYGLKIDPETPFILGEGGVYYKFSYPLKPIYITLLLTIVVLLIYRKRRIIPYDW